MLEKWQKTTQLHQNVFQIEANMSACERRHMSTSVLGIVSVCKPPPNTPHWRQKKFQRLEKSGLYCFMKWGNDSWNQGMNHITRHLWNQNEHNLADKCPDYGQPQTLKMFSQTMISLESYSSCYHKIWSACFCMGGQRGKTIIFGKLFC